MTSTGAVAQAPVQAGEAVGDRTRGGGRNGQEGGFPGLLSALAAGGRDRSSSGTSPAGEARLLDGDRHRLAGLLGGNAESLAADGSAEALGAFASELAAAVGMEGSGDASGLALASGDQGGGLAQAIGGNGMPAAISGVIALAVANGDPIDQDALQLAKMPGGGAQPLAGDLVPTDTGTAFAAAPPDGEGAPETVAMVAILRRETHLAPVHAAAVFAPATPGAPALSSGAGPGSDAARDAAPAPGSTGVEHGGDAPPTVPRLAVTAARGAGLGAPLGQDRRAAFAGPQAGADAGADGTAAPDPAQATPVARADATAHPGSVSGPVQQVALRVSAEVSAAAQARPEAAAFVPQGQLASPVKVLHIQLQPADLGTVTVRLSLKEQSLRLDLEVGRGETAHLIQREREVLSALLRSAGYLVDGLDVRVADPNAAGTSASGSQPSMQMPGDGQAGSSQADARSHGARSQGERRGNAFGNERNSEDEQAGHPARRSDIYV